MRGIGLCSVDDELFPVEAVVLLGIAHKKGVVSIVIGRIEGKNRDELHMELWLMSCRVLKRDMEFAMMDELVDKAKAMGIRKIIGYYYPTAKNAMVKEFYGLQGFRKIKEDEEGNTTWEFVIDDHYEKKQHVIKVNEQE